VEAMSSIGLCVWKKSGRSAMGTNFLSLPSGGFTGLKPKQQPAPSHSFLPDIKDIPTHDFDQRVFAVEYIV
jgi:hypothetical protein